MATQEQAEIDKHWLLQQEITAALRDKFPSTPSRENIMQCIDEFRRRTSLQANSAVACAVCGELHRPSDVTQYSLLWDERQRDRSFVSRLPILGNNLLAAMKRWLQNRSAAPTPMPKQPDRPGLKKIAGMALEYLGVDEEEQTLTMCMKCCRSLQRNVRPALAVANGFCSAQSRSLYGT